MVDTEVKVCFDMSADNSDQQISSNKRCTGPLHEVEGQERPAGYYQRFGATGTTEEEILAVIRDYLRKHLSSKVIEAG
jgi:hypothetical protein